MDIIEMLDIAGVPKHLHAEAHESINMADKRSDGVLLKKIKVRLFKSKEIAKLLAWEDERLCLKHPELADWDIAPMINITAYGDNGPWVETPEGGRPAGNVWLNKDPNSEEYKEAVKMNYWCKGTHPRSDESHRAWYKRNGGEYLVWRLGEKINPKDDIEIWRGFEKNHFVKVTCVSGAWIIVSSKKLIGKLNINVRVGFEVDNIMCGHYSPQAWFPIPGFDLKAPVTWSKMPGTEMVDLTPKLWEQGFNIPNGENKTYTKFVH